MIVAANDDGLCMFDFEYRKMMPSIQKRITSFLNDEFAEADHPLFETVQSQFEEYLDGNRKDFDLPLVLSGTPFQQRVWNELRNIPYGATRTYLQQSKVLGDEKAIRAVARANGENCLAVIIPCHRIIGSDGSLTGYAGGLKNKKWLLEHEARHAGTAYQAQMFLV